MPPDRELAASWLRRIGYYRLSGYWYPFRVRENGVALDTFRPKTTLERVFNLYVFDKRLRLLMLDAIERVEVGLRVDAAISIGKGGSLAHRDPGNFNQYFNRINAGRNMTHHALWLERLDELCGRSKEEFAKHFRGKYSGEFPIWIAIELWDFGILSQIFNGLHDRYLQPLAVKYALPRRTMLVSWVQALNFVRNVCAHHGRLWNRPLVNQPAMPRHNEIPLLQHWLSMQSPPNSRLYAAASILQYFLRTMSPRSTWGERLKGLIGQFPEKPDVLVSGGFPKGWQDEEIWNA